MTITIQFGKDRYHQQAEMERWCQDHVSINPDSRNWVSGEPGSWTGLDTWCMSSIFGNTFFYFKNPKDATLFSLRWL